MKQKRNLKDGTDLKITFKILHNNIYATRNFEFIHTRFFSFFSWFGW